MKPSLVCGAVLLATVCGCSSSNDTKDLAAGTRSSSSSPAVCSAASATPAPRALVTPRGLEPTCVKVTKGEPFTLLNADDARHDFTTTKASPTPLRVQLRRNAAFPYRFEKVGTYTFEDAASHLVLTVIVQ